MVGNVSFYIYSINSRFFYFLFYIFVMLMLSVSSMGGYHTIMNQTVKFESGKYHSFGKNFYPSLILLILFVFFEFIFPAPPFSLMFLFAFISLVPFSYFYGMIETRDSSKQLFYGKLVLKRSSVTDFAAVFGFFLGLYIYLIHSFFSTLLLIFLLLYLLAGASYFAISFYKSASRNLNLNSMTAFKKFEKENSVTASQNIYFMGKAFDRFEKEGVKDDLIIAVTKFLSENGKNVEYIKKSLKSIMDYEKPIPVIMGAANGTRVFQEDLENRKRITKVIIENISIIGENNE